MEQIYEDEKRKFIKEFNDNCGQTKEAGSRLINVLKIIIKKKGGIKMPYSNKLSKEQIAEIISRTDVNLDVLAKEYGVSSQAIHYWRTKNKKSLKTPRKAERTPAEVVKVEKKVETHNDASKKEVKTHSDASLRKKMIEPPDRLLRFLYGQRIKITIEINPS